MTTRCLDVSDDLKPQLSPVYVIVFMSIVFNMSHRSEIENCLGYRRKEKNNFFKTIATKKFCQIIILAEKFVVVYYLP